MVQPQCHQGGSFTKQRAMERRRATRSPGLVTAAARGALAGRGAEDARQGGSCGASARRPPSAHGAEARTKPGLAERTQHMAGSQARLADAAEDASDGDGPTLGEVLRKSEALLLELRNLTAGGDVAAGGGESGALVAAAGAALRQSLRGEAPAPGAAARAGSASPRLAEAERPCAKTFANGAPRRSQSASSTLTTCSSLSSAASAIGRVLAGDAAGLGGTTLKAARESMRLLTQERDVLHLMLKTATKRLEAVEGRRRRLLGAAEQAPDGGAGAPSGGDGSLGGRPRAADIAIVATRLAELQTAASADVERTRGAAMRRSLLEQAGRLGRALASANRPRHRGASPCDPRLSGVEGGAPPQSPSGREEAARGVGAAGGPRPRSPVAAGARRWESGAESEASAPSATSAAATAFGHEPPGATCAGLEFDGIGGGSAAPASLRTEVGGGARRCDDVAVGDGLDGLRSISSGAADVRRQLEEVHRTLLGAFACGGPTEAPPGAA